MKIKQLSIIMICFMTIILSLNSYAKTTITYGVWDDEQAKGIRKVLPYFKKDHPDIEVELQVMPWDNYWAGLDAAASGKAMPDVAWMNVYNFGRYMVSGVIKDLTPYIEKDKFDMSTYYKTSVSPYTFDGRHYAVPRDIDSIALWYNKAIFRKAGLEYPNSSWTWDDVERAAQVIKEKLPEVYYPVAMQLKGQGDFTNLFHQAGGSEIEPGGKVSGFDKPGTIIALKWVKKLFENKYLPSAKSFSTFSAYNSFSSNKAAMMYGGSWRGRPIALNPMISENVGIADLPSYKKGDKKISVSHSIGLVIANNSKHPKEAWELVKFLTGEKGAKLLATNGVIIPANKKVKGAWTNSPIFKKANLDLSVHENALNYVIPLDTSLNAEKWHEYELMQIKKVWLGKMSPEEFGKLMAKYTNKILKKDQTILANFRKKLKK